MRLKAIGTAAAAAVVTGALAVRYAGQATAGPFDRVVAEGLHEALTDRTYGDHLAYPSGNAGVVTALVLVAAVLAPPR